MENSISLFSVKAHDNAVTKGYLCKQSEKYIFTSSPGDVIKLWSIHNTSPVSYYNTEKANVMEMKTDMNETRFGYSTDHSKIHVIDMGSSKVLRSLSNEQNMYTTFEFLDASRMVCCLSNSRIQIIDLNSKSIITEFIGHNAPIYRIGQFHGSSEFYTIDTSGVVNIWDHRVLRHRISISFPPNSNPLPINNDLFAYYSSNTIFYTTSNTHTPLITIPISFQPSSFYSVLDKDLLLSSSSSLYHFSYQSNRIHHLGEISGLLDVGKEQAMLLPILTTYNSTITLTGISLHQYPSFTSSHVLSQQEREEVQTIKQHFLPTDISRLSTANSILDSDSSILESDSSFLSNGTVVKTSVQYLQSPVCSSDDGSMIISEDSLISPTAPRKVIKPRLSTSIMRSSYTRMSDSHHPSTVVPQPRKSIVLTSALVKAKASKSNSSSLSQTNDATSSINAVSSTICSISSPSTTPRQSLSSKPVRSSLPPLSQTGRLSSTPIKPSVQSPTTPVKASNKSTLATSTVSHLNRSTNPQGGRMNQSIASPTRMTQSVTTPTRVNQSISTPTRVNQSISSPTRMSQSVATPTRVSQSVTTPTRINQSISSPTTRLTPKPTKRPSSNLVSPIPSKVQQSPLRNIHSQPTPNETPAMKDNEEIVNVLSNRRQSLKCLEGLLHDQVEKQGLLEYLKGVNDCTVLSFCLKACEQQLTPTSVNEMTEILPILNPWIQSSKEKGLLSILQFLRVILQELQKMELTGEVMDLKNQLGLIEVSLMNLNGSSFHSPLLPLYITECLNLLDCF